MNSTNAARAYYARARYQEGLSALAARRRINARPLSRPERLRNDERLSDIATALAGENDVNQVKYYGHPAHRIGYVGTVHAIAYPDTYRRIAAATGSPLSRISCAYTFSL